IAQKCSWLSLSAEGLVVTLPEAGEAWVVNASTLKVEQQITVNSPVRTIAGVNSSLAVAYSANETELLDLKTGKVLVSGKETLRHAVMSADGKYLYAHGGISQLQQYSVAKTGLKLEQSSERIAGAGHSVQVSSDGKYVCLPTGTGNGGKG